ncbi:MULTISPECIES: hypothetical protein [unclassified Bacillus cereus group]|uniref:hypothetical protein n=1 Tax=unclassified Bacillus cereus group TaxID=2750818 RepID=UPI00339A2294
MEFLDPIFQIADTFYTSWDTSEKVYNAAMAGADAWALYAIIAGAVGPLAIGAGVVAYMIKKKIKGFARAAAIAW